MDSELNEILSKNFLMNIHEKFHIYKGCLVLDTYEKIADAIENFEVRDDDVWVCSFPKSGTTWTQEMVWSIANGLNERAEISLADRFPYLEAPGILPLWAELSAPTYTSLGTTDLGYIESIAKLPSPRFIKTHLPFHLLPRQLREREKNCKIIYVYRNPKDACISFYHFCNTRMGYCGSLENFCKLFLGGKVLYAPYWPNVNSYLKRKDDNILSIKFEDMKSDLRSVISKVATFLGKTLNDEQVEKLQDHLSFARMKNNPAVNYKSVYTNINATKPFGESFEIKQPFIRSGQTGEWKSLMSKELVKQFDDWIEENSD